MLRERLCSTLVPTLDVAAIFQDEKRMSIVEKTKGKTTGKNLGKKGPGFEVALAVGKELSGELHVLLNISNIRSGIENIDISKKYRYHLLNCECRLRP